MGGGNQSSPTPTPGNQPWVTPPQFRWTPDRKVSDEIPFADELEMRFRARIINDILKGKINLDELQQLHDNMGTEDNSLPNMKEFRPIS